MTGRPKRNREAEDAAAEAVLKQYLEDGSNGLRVGLNADQLEELRVRLGESEVTIDTILEQLAPDEELVSTDGYKDLIQQTLDGVEDSLLHITMNAVLQASLADMTQREVATFLYNFRQSMKVRGIV